MTDPAAQGEAEIVGSHQRADPQPVCRLRHPQRKIGAQQARNREASGRVAKYSERKEFEDEDHRKRKGFRAIGCATRRWPVIQSRRPAIDTRKARSLNRKRGRATDREQVAQTACTQGSALALDPEQAADR